MGAFVFNVAKGRTVELYRRVKGEEPSIYTPCLVIVILATAGLESDAVLKDKDTLAAILAGATNEVTNTGYERIVLNDGDLAALPAPDDTNNRYDLPLPTPVFTGVEAGSGWSKLLVCYNFDTVTGTDADIVPMTCHDIAIDPNGTVITINVPAAGFFRAQDAA
jgi:hypothetical protein